MTSEAPFTIRRYAGISLPKSMTVAWYGGGDSQGFPRAWAREGCSFPGEHVRPVGSKLTLLFEVPGGFVQAQAVVRNVCLSEGMGVEFTHLRPQARLLVGRLAQALVAVKSPPDGCLKAEAFQATSGSCGFPFRL